MAIAQVNLKFKMCIVLIFGHLFILVNDQILIIGKGCVLYYTYFSPSSVLQLTT